MLINSFTSHGSQLDASTQGGQLLTCPCVELSRTQSRQTTKDRSDELSPNPDLPLHLLCGSSSDSCPLIYIPAWTPDSILVPSQSPLQGLKLPKCKPKSLSWLQTQSVPENSFLKSSYLQSIYTSFHHPIFIKSTQVVLFLMNMIKL